MCLRNPSLIEIQHLPSVSVPSASNDDTYQAILQAIDNMNKEFKCGKWIPRTSESHFIKFISDSG